MNIFKILLLAFSLQNVNSKDIDEKPMIEQKENINKESKPKKNSFYNKIKKIFNHMEKKQKFYSKVEHGHKLEKLDQIKIGMHKKDVINILGTPAEIKCIKDSFYYISQTNKIFFTFNLFSKGKIVKIIFKNGKVKKIIEINMKKVSKNIELYIKLKQDIKKQLKEI